MELGIGYIEPPQEDRRWSPPEHYNTVYYNFPPGLIGNPTTLDPKTLRRLDKEFDDMFASGPPLAALKYPRGDELANEVKSMRGFTMAKE